MISANKPIKPESGLLRRVQRYAQASTIFRTGDSDEGGVQRAAAPRTKATFLSQPSTLPVGRTIDADGIGTIPVASTFPMELPTTSVATPISSGDSLSAALDQITQLQRAPERGDVGKRQAATETPSPMGMPTATPPAVGQPMAVASENVMPATPAIESDTSASDWTRLQRIIKGHEAKQTDSQPENIPPQPMQQDGTETTAVSPHPPSSQPSPPVKRAPLESVWPVQQVEKAAPVTDEPIVMQQPDTPISTEPTQSPAEAETIRRKLGDVVSTKRTDSSIELHLPRRPRPAPIQTKAAPPDPNKAFWERMRKAEGKPPETVQRTVDTEIGPLPADMWELLGQNPPGLTPTPDPITKTAVPHSESAAPNLQKTDIGKEKTAVPSFLAHTTTEAPVNMPPPEADTASVQRTIVEAETEISGEKVEPHPPTAAPPTIQRKAAITPEPQPPTTEQPRSESPKQAIEPTAPPSREAPAKATLQREVETADSPPSEQIQSAADSLESTNIPPATKISTSAETDTPIKTTASPVSVPAQVAAQVPPSASATSLQRAVAAAESPPSPSAKTPRSVPILSAPGESMPPPTSTANLQRAVAAAESPPSPSAETPQSAPIISAPGKTEESAAAPTSQPKPMESAPTPPAKPMRQTVLPEPISQEEAPSSRWQGADEMSALSVTKDHVDWASSPVQRSAESSDVIQKTAVDLNADTAPLPELPETDTLETAVSPPLSSADASFDTPTASQRAIAAAEAPARQADTSQAATAKRQPSATAKTTNAAIQRTATTPTASAPTQTQPTTAPIDKTAVFTPTPPTAAPVTSQQAIVNTETPRPIPHPAETMPVSRETHIQRAISAAEAPSSPPAAAPTRIQHGTMAPETAVFPTPTLVQNSKANGKQITQEPQTSTPLTSSSTTPSLMRAIAAAESPAPKPTPATTQGHAKHWDDILPPSPAETTATIQRSATETSTPHIQRQSPEPQEDNFIDNEDNQEDENSEPINVNQLANEVYSQLKKRLAIEWERGRGKR